MHFMNLDFSHYATFLCDNAQNAIVAHVLFQCLLLVSSDNMNELTPSL